MNSYCGVLAIVGESNAGKSQLLNAFLQAPLAVVHHKRNLTRERMRAVITQGERQLVIEDTAGLAGKLAGKLAGMPTGLTRITARGQGRTPANISAKTTAKTTAKSLGESLSKTLGEVTGNSTPSNRRAIGRDYWTRRMREEALSAARSADLKLWVVDATRGERALHAAISLAQQAGAEAMSAAGKLEESSAEPTELRKHSFFALNKIDLVRDKRLLLPLAAQLEAAQCCSEVFMLSAKKGDGIARARESLLQALAPAPFLYAKDGDTREHETIACEITRGVLYQRLHEELPYDALVENELTEKNEDGSLRFAQRLLLRRESQRRVLLTREGRLLHSLERLAELALRKHFACEVQLNLHVPRARDW